MSVYMKSLYSQRSQIIEDTAEPSCLPEKSQSMHAWKNTVEWKRSGTGAGRSRSGSGAASGGYRKRRERWAEISTAPAPLTCYVPDQATDQARWIFFLSCLIRWPPSYEGLHITPLAPQWCQSLSWSLTLKSWSLMNSSWLSLWLVLYADICHYTHSYHILTKYWIKLMPTCNRVILWHTVYLLVIVLSRFYLQLVYNLQVGLYDTCLDCRLGVSEFF